MAAGDPRRSEEPWWKTAGDPDVADDPAGWDDLGGPADEAWDAAGDPRVQAGLDHLQRAAREVIAASRALLDVAEELVDDPRAAAGMVDLLGSVSALRRRVAGDGQPGASRPDDGDDGDDGPPVQRIPVS